MNLQHRIDLLFQLGRYISGNSDEWVAAMLTAHQKNGWFIPEFIDQSVRHIARNYLEKGVLENWAEKYTIPAENKSPKQVGVVMAGNIPLVGFHDFLAVFMTGNKILIKPSSKDETLIRHLVGKLEEWDPAVTGYAAFSEMLKGCDAYIATGSNNSSRYFDYYFGKYPNIIRRNRSSVAVITGEETPEELDLLADDVYSYFGLGCRNVTKLYVPAGYDFVPILTAFKKYDFLADHHKYKNNYDYNLALHLLNKKYYMTNGSVLLMEEQSIFSPISQLNYEFYQDEKQIGESLKDNRDLQCVVGKKYLSFGSAQYPGVDDFADGINTLGFLLKM